MRIGVPLESRPGETRVAATPETVKKLVAGKHSIVVQAGAGVAASQPDAAYTPRPARRSAPQRMRSAPTSC
jgi:NAD(P) transhydrogenase subunit alpha